MNERMLEALNDQLNFELYSGYIYLSMSAYFHSTGLGGMAHWMRVQWNEELGHATRLFDYIADRGARLDMRPIPGPAKAWESPLQAFEVALGHEQMVTARMHKLADLATEIGDPATVGALQWFIKEQVEEEENVSRVIELLKTLGSTPEGLIVVDRQIGERK